MEKEIKVLLAEDDKNLGTLLQEYLIAKKYNAELYDDGEKALDAFRKSDYDLCIFDVMMPKMDGFTLAKEIRKADEQIPIIFLTAKSLKEDLIEGFQSGADDYLTKPFSMDELMLRIKAILRRTGDKKSISSQMQFQIGEFEFDAQKQLLKHEGDEKKLTTKESELLRLLCVNQNNLLDRNDALNEVWSDDNYFNARSMDVYITKLRKLLKADEHIQIINIHGKGFKLLVD
ncbi:MAG: response regulator transcription factor [Bacteroidales bacterium]|nr:response regulator transcription factor [Bacteroidales bacterium]